MPLDRELVGARIGVDERQVSRDELVAYALATNDPNPAYVGDGEVVAPPMFPVVPGFAAQPRKALEAMGIYGVGERLGLHGEQDMRIAAPIRPGETIITVATVEGIEEVSVGELAHIAVRTETAAGELRCDSRWSIIFIDEDESVAPRRRGPATVPAQPPTASVEMEVAADQTHRYAAASGDHNPPHVDAEVARSFGYPDVFLQGLCTMAFAGQAIVDVLADSDPTRLRRLRVRLSSPVFPGDVLTTRIWSGDGSANCAFDTVNQAGVAVLAKGLAELVP